MTVGAPEWALPKIMAHTGKALRGCPHLVLENQCLAMVPAQNAVVFTF